ncbi:MAG: hypothetical protein QME81_13220 [bacterium]|nr:hypothetical protein [bacterium]
MGKKVEKEEATTQVEVEQKKVEAEQKQKGNEETGKAKVETERKSPEGNKVTSEKQGMGSNRPLFIPQTERIKENIHNRIFVTERAVGPYLIPDKIYFADKEGNLIASRNIFPEDTKKRGSVRIFKSPGGKYIAVESDYSIPADATDTEAWEFEGEFVKASGAFRVMEGSRINGVNS